MADFFQDIHYALRQLRKSPGFAFTVVLTLALSVGVATAVFCVIDTVILQPLPYTQPDKIVFIRTNSRAGYTQPASWPSFQDERARAKVFEALAGYSEYKKITMEMPGASPVSLDCVRSTDNFFRVFGVQPILGRTYLPGEEQDGRNHIVVLSYEAWQKEFNGDRAVLNKAVKLDGAVFTVIGVMPASFRYPLNKREAIYIPWVIDQTWMQHRGSHWMRSIARLKDGVTLQQAQADFTHVLSNLGTAYPDTDGGRIAKLLPLAQSINSQSQGPLWTLLGAVLAVLAIGCVNVAGLLLARGVKREREMAMRTAIGAGRMRLVAQMLTEGLMLALLAAIGGVFLAWTMLALMRVFLIKALARGADIQLNWTVLAVAIGIAVTASLVASLLPAIRLSSIDPIRALRAGGNAGTQRGQHRLRSGFVITQVALTLVLLVVAGLLLRVVSRYRNVDLGFEPSRILSVKIGISRSAYQNRDVLTALYKPLEERVSHLPGVEAAGLIDVLPIDNWGNNSDTHIAGQPPYPPNQEMLAESRMVSAGYFDVMGIPIHRGRKLSSSLDRPENTAATVMVNDAFVRKFIPAGLDPTAQRIDDSPKQDNWTKIVGVSGNVRQSIYDPPMAEHDWLMDEIPLNIRTETFADMTLVVRAKSDPTLAIAAIRNVIHNLDPTIPFPEPRTMTDVVAETLVFERMESWLFGIFAGLALALAMVGLYGLVSQEVQQGTRDIGVRMALGATRHRVLGMVFKRVSLMLAAGTIAGLVLTVIVKKMIGMVIYFDAQKEIGGFLIVVFSLIVAGLIAALIPAIQAASIEPMKALRSE